MKKNKEYLTHEQLVQLHKSQREVVEYIEKSSICLAMPGSGKTATLVNKVEFIVPYLKKWEKILVISFSNAATKEIKNRLTKNSTKEKVEVCTIDSFIKRQIEMHCFKFIKWQGYNLPSLEQRRIRAKAIFSKRNSTANKIVIYDACLEIDTNDFKRWINLIIERKIEISYACYVCLIKLINSKITIRKALNFQFRYLLIDEVQDLNDYQIRLIEALREKCNIQIHMFGDLNQSIYQFRGAKPEKIKQLLNNEEIYKTFRLPHSFRSHPSITRFAGTIFNEPVIKNINKIENQVRILSGDYISEIRKIYEENSEIFILCPTNENCSKIQENLSKAGMNFNLSKILKIRKDLEEEYLEVEQVLSLFFDKYANKSNPITKYKSNWFSLGEELSDIWQVPWNSKWTRGIEVMSLGDLVKHINEKLQLELRPELIEELCKDEMEMEVKKIFLKDDFPNKIMTIHGSKGLEADTVVIIVTELYKNPVHTQDEDLRKLYVAVTRAKRRVFFIAYDATGESSNYMELIKNIHSKMLSNL